MISAIISSEPWTRSRLSTAIGRSKSSGEVVGPSKSPPSAPWVSRRRVSVASREESRSSVAVTGSAAQSASDGFVIASRTWGSSGVACRSVEAPVICRVTTSRARSTAVCSDGVSGTPFAVSINEDSSADRARLTSRDQSASAMPGGRGGASSGLSRVDRPGPM